MWCSMCPFLLTCEDPAQLGGGCDCDGADDFGADPIDDYTDDDDFDDNDFDDYQTTNQNQQGESNEKSHSKP